MSDIALDKLLAAHVALDLALDGHDTQAIVTACECFRSAIFDVRAVGAWRERPELARKSADILGRVELSQQRVKNLTREGRERMAGLDTARARLGVSLYNRGGQPGR